MLIEGFSDCCNAFVLISVGVHCIDISHNDKIVLGDLENPDNFYKMVGVLDVGFVR